MASNRPSTRLRELHGSGFEIKKGQPDIRGWDVRDDNRHKYGKVQELIFDIRANKVRYLVVSIFDTKELELEKRTVLVPIGLAVLDGADDDVILPAVTPFQLRALPRYDKDKLGAKAERDISYVFGRNALDGNTANANNELSDDDVDNSFYEHDHFNEENMQKNRRGTAANQLNSEREKTTHTANSEKRNEGQIYYRKGDELHPLNPNADRIEDTTVNNNLADRNETDEESIRRVRQNDDGADYNNEHKETDEEYVKRARKNLDR